MLYAKEGMRSRTKALLGTSQKGEEEEEVEEETRACASYDAKPIYICQSTENYVCENKIF